MHQLDTLLSSIFAGEELITMIFSNKRRKSMEQNKVTIRPVILSGQKVFQVEHGFDQKVTHENLTGEEALDLSQQLIFEDFKQINIFTISEDIQVLASKPKKAHITTGLPTKGVPNLDHNKKKNYILAEDVPCDFLIRLGVMDDKGKIAQKHYSKFRQINRYLEIVEDAYPYLPSDQPLKIIDFGCGKAYLTFALYHYLQVVKGRDVVIIGLDLKKDVIAFCSKVAEDLHYDGLQFLLGDIADYAGGHADMVVTLHACDTATDYALINAVSWDAKVILSVPCCQHELFNQIKDDIHQPMLKHGILKDRLTEYLTDGLRGLKLESKGYEVSMIEFTSLEHTARNIMIKGIKLGSPNSPKSKKAHSEYEALRDFYHVNPTIEQL